MAARAHRPRPPWLDERLRRWVEAGIISADQAKAIAQLEAGETILAPPGGEPTPPAGRLPLLAEALAYLGIILVTASGAVVVARFWRDLLVGGRLSVGVLVALVGLGSGAALGRSADPGTRRLSSFLLLCGTGGVGIVAGVAAVALGSNDAGLTALVVGLAVLAVSLVLWQNRDRALAFLGTLGGAVTAVVGLQDVLQLGPTPTEAGATVCGTGLGLAVLGWWRIAHPPRTVLLVGALGALGGALAISGDHAAVGLPLGLVLAALVVVGGIAAAEPLLIGVGVVGFLVFLARTLAIYVHGTVSAITVLVLGIALVLGALSRWHRHGGMHPPRPRRPRPRWRADRTS